eukprot:CFRG4940T1
MLKLYSKTTLAIASATAVGDIICQHVDMITSCDNYHWDKARTLRMFGVGALMGPIMQAFHIKIEHLLPGNSNARVLQKVLVNTMMGPALISINFTTNTLLQGKSLSDAQTKVISDMPRTFAHGSLYWPFVSALQFKLVSLAYRPIFGSGAAVLWNTYLSGVGNRDMVESEDPAHMIDNTVIVLQRLSTEKRRKSSSAEGKSN